MPDPVGGERIARQQFVRRQATTPAEAAHVVCGIQAQDPQAARLGIRARAAGVSEEAVHQALTVDRSVVKSSLMRATIHLVAADDLRWLAAVTGPVIARKFQKRWRDLGLTADVLHRTLAALPTVLADGPRSRGEIMADLAELGIAIDTGDQAPAHVLLQAATEGLVCRGPDRGRDATFVLVDEWLPTSAPGPRGDDALAELARRFFAAFSPATAADFTTWSGLPSARAIALIRDELTPTTVYGRPGYTLGSVEPARGLRLLPAFDNYLTSYRDRDAILVEAQRSEVYIGGIIRPTVLHDGRVIGRWQLTRNRTATVTVTPFEPLSARVRRQLEAEAADVGAFVGLPAELITN